MHLTIKTSERKFRMTLNKLILALLLICSSVSGFADEAPANVCTRKAIDQIKNANAEYIAYFAQHKSRQAIDDIRAITPPQAFLTRHEAELKMLADDTNYQPSQALCDDVYAIQFELNKQLKAVADKYHYVDD